MGGITDKALSLLPPTYQRVVIAMILGGVMTASYLSVTDSIASARDSAQQQIDQLKATGAHRDGRLDKIEAALSAVAVNQATMQQSLGDTQRSVTRIENKVDALPARIRRDD